MDLPSAPTMSTCWKEFNVRLWSFLRSMALLRYEAVLNAGSKGAIQQWRLVTEEIDFNGRFSFARMSTPSVPSFAATPLLAGQVSTRGANRCSTHDAAEASCLFVAVALDAAILPRVQGLVIKVTQDISGILTESLLRPLLLLALYSPPSFAAAPLMSSPAAVSAAGGTARPLRVLLHSNAMVASWRDEYKQHAAQFVVRYMAPHKFWRQLYISSVL